MSESDRPRYDPCERQPQTLGELECWAYANAAGGLMRPRPVSLSTPPIPGLERLAIHCDAKYAQRLGIDSVKRLIAEYAGARGVSRDEARLARLPQAADVLAPDPNPLHGLIELLDRFVRALWRCHHAGSGAVKDETLTASLAQTGPFWRTHRIPVEAVHGLADPAVAWCSRRGLAGPEDVAAVENAAAFITELARLTVPAAMPSLYSDKAEVQAIWERQGKFFQEALGVQSRLRGLTARAGDAWPWNARLHWDADGGAGAGDGLPADAHAADSGERQSAGPGRKHKVSVRWGDWALGVEYEGKWQLFRLVGGAWQHRGVLNTRKGLQHRLLEGFGKGRGVLLQEDAARLWHEQPSRSDKARIRGRLAPEVSKLRNLIRDRIRKALGVAGEVTDPLPRYKDPALWRTEILIGCARVEDGGRAGAGGRLRFAPWDDGGT